MPLELPSGNVALVKRPGMEKLLRMGLMPDSLTPIAMQHLATAESGGRPMSKKDENDIERQMMEKILQDPKELEDLMLTFDRVVVEVCVEPKVRMGIYTEADVLEGLVKHDESKVTEKDVGNDIPDEDRDEELLYADDVDIEDKQFIFQFVVGGSSDLEQFRREQAATVEAS